MVEAKMQLLLRDAITKWLRDSDASGSGRGNSTWKPSASARAQACELAFNPLFMLTSELREHDGQSEDGMLLLAIRSSRSDAAVVLDVSAGADYYAPGMAYHCLTGRDCSRAFSLSSLKPEHLHADMSEATDSEWATLDEWADKLTQKYPTVGFLMPDRPQAPVEELQVEDDEWRMVGLSVAG